MNIHMSRKMLQNFIYIIHYLFFNLGNHHLGTLVFEYIINFYDF